MNTDKPGVSETVRRGRRAACDTLVGEPVVPQAARLPRRTRFSCRHTLQCKALSKSKKLRHRLGWIWTTALLLPVHAWVWLAAENPVLSVLNGAVPTFILSGRMCTERFSIIHAGSALDQPTIGKWLFWFTVMAATALPCTAGVGWLANRTSKAGRIAFSVNTFVLGFMLLSILSWPVLWLIQYICSMGFTPRRIQGLLYSISAAAGIILFLIWATRKPQSRQPRSQP